jgi:predicted MFS family arabinose efflux permease
MSKVPLFSSTEKRLLAALAFIQFSHIVDFMIMMPLGPQLMRIFDITPHQFGILVSSYTFAAGASGLAAAFVIDRFDRKTSLLFFYLGFTLGTLACALSPNYEMLLLSRTLTGIFGGVLNSLIFAIVGDAIAPQKRASAMGLVMTAFSIASVFGVPFSLFLANQYNWHAPFFFLGFVSLGMIALIIKAVPKVNGHLSHERPAHWYLPVLTVFKNPNQVTALTFQALLIFGQFSIIPFLSPSMVANAGMSESQLPFIYLVGGGVSMFGGPFMGRMADKYGKKKIFLLAAFVSLLPIYLITHLGPTPLYLLLPLVGFFFFCMNGRIVPSTALITSTVHAQNRGTFMSIATAVQQFSAALASWIAGLIIVRTAEGHLDGYQTVGLISIAFSLLAMFMVRRIVPIEGDNR